MKSIKGLFLREFFIRDVVIRDFVIGISSYVVRHGNFVIRWFIVGS